MLNSLKIGLIGCGAMGTTIADALLDGIVEGAELHMVYDIKLELGQKIVERSAGKVALATEIKDVVNCKDLNLIVEAASQAAVRECLPLILQAGKNVLVMSVGVFSDMVFFEKMKSLAIKNNCKLLIPSGAIAGLDAIKSAKLAGLSRVSLCTRKPPKALEGAPFVVKNKVNLNSIKEPTLLYEGPAKEAASLFPANVNVAIALSLAGIGPEETLVQIVADPTTSRNIHEISAVGKFGNLEVKIENLPSTENPKTSMLAILSAIRKLKELTETVSIGT